MTALILNSVDAAVDFVVEGVEANNDQNSTTGACWSTWDDAEHAVDTYVDGDNAVLAKGVNRKAVLKAFGEILTEKKAYEQAPAGVALCDDDLVYAVGDDLAAARVEGESEGVGNVASLAVRPITRLQRDRIEDGLTTIKRVFA